MFGVRPDSPRRLGTLARCQASPFLARAFFVVLTCTNLARPVGAQSAGVPRVRLASQRSRSDSRYRTDLPTFTNGRE